MFSLKAFLLTPLYYYKVGVLDAVGSPEILRKKYQSSFSGFSDPDEPENQVLPYGSNRDPKTLF